MSVAYHEYRCGTCKKLLFKGVLIDSEIEIKCKGCHSLQKVVADSKDEYLCAVRRCPNRVKLSR